MNDNINLKTESNFNINNNNQLINIIHFSSNKKENEDFPKISNFKRCFSKPLLVEDYDNLNINNKKNLSKLNNIINYINNNNMPKKIDPIALRQVGKSLLLSMKKRNENNLKKYDNNNNNFLMTDTDINLSDLSSNVEPNEKNKNTKKK